MSQSQGPRGLYFCDQEDICHLSPFTSTGPFLVFTSRSHLDTLGVGSSLYGWLACAKVSAGNGDREDPVHSLHQQGVVHAIFHKAVQPMESSPHPSGLMVASLCLPASTAPMSPLKRSLPEGPRQSPKPPQMSPLYSHGDYS